MPITQHELPAHPVTHGPKFHWFGYYDKFPWDATGRYLLSLEVDFMDRAPTPDDVATVGMVDLQDGNKWTPLAQTRVFNWQQGTHLQWLPTAPDREIIYNSLAADGQRYVPVIQDVFTGQRRELPLPIYAVSRDGKQAVSLDFDRVHSTRPGYGYHLFPDRAGPDIPEDQGLYTMDLQTGEHRRIITVKQITEFEPQDTFEGARHWFNHLQFNADGTRFIFLHRWKKPGHPWNWKTRLFTASPDGSDICCLNEQDMTSHFDWRGSDTVLAWAHRDGTGDHYYLFKDQTHEIELLGADVFPTDGHCSYSPDLQWILTDTYPDEEHKRTLILYRVADNLRVDIGRFYSPPELQDRDPQRAPYEIRCDLHPRWSRDGRQVCFDSMHEGERQVYVMDVGEVVG